MFFRFSFNLIKFKYNIKNFNYLIIKIRRFETKNLKKLNLNVYFYKKANQFSCNVNSLTLQLNLQLNEIKKNNNI